MILYKDSNAVMTSNENGIAQHESHSQQPLVNFKIICLLSMFLMGVLLMRWFLQLTLHACVGANTTFLNT